MNNSLFKPDQWSISRQIGLLILCAMLLLTAANFAVTFAGPPPRAAPLDLEKAAQILRGGERSPGPQRFLREIDSRAFVPRSGEARDSGAEALLGRMLGVPTDRVAVAKGGARLLAGRDNRPSTMLDNFSIGLETAPDRWLILRSTPQPLLTAWHRTTIAITLAIAALLGLIASRMARGITRPLRRLSREAEQAYAEGRQGAITVEGAPEIAHLARTIRAMRDRFADAIDNRTMMLAAISHDMAAPLSRLQFHIAKMPPDVRGQAEDDVNELAELISSIMSYARGQQWLDPQQIDLVGLARSIVERSDRVDAPVSLLVAPEQALVMGDRVALQRLTGNLLGNAQRYAGGGNVEIYADAETVTLIVADNGPGFDPTLAEKLFEPFFRIEESRSRETAGVGLGLATARSIAEAHSGTLIARSIKGQGAQFILTIPTAA